MQVDVNKTFDNIQLAISKLSGILSFQEKKTYPLQPQPIIREKHEVNEACRSSTKEDEVKVVITLTNRKELEQPKSNARKNKKKGKKLKIEDDEKNERTKAKSFKE